MIIFWDIRSQVRSRRSAIGFLAVARGDGAVFDMTGPWRRAGPEDRFPSEGVTTQKGKCCGRYPLPGLDYDYRRHSSALSGDRITQFNSTKTTPTYVKGSHDAVAKLRGTPKKGDTAHFPQRENLGFSIHRGGTGNHSSVEENRRRDAGDQANPRLAGWPSTGRVRFIRRVPGTVHRGCPRPTGCRFQAGAVLA